MKPKQPPLSPHQQKLRNHEDLAKRTCPACIEGRLHTPAENQQHHPHTGHGFTPETGWTHPDLDPGNRPPPPPKGGG